jgi:hypothetical protein
MSKYVIYGRLIVLHDKKTKPIFKIYESHASGIKIYPNTNILVHNTHNNSKE